MKVDSWKDFYCVLGLNGWYDEFFRVLEDQIQEFDLEIERTKDKIIAKCCALVAVLIGQALRFEIRVSWLDV